MVFTIKFYKLFKLHNYVLLLLVDSELTVDCEKFAFQNGQAYESMRTFEVYLLSTVTVDANFDWILRD